MRTLLLLRGAMGSGKSTWIQNNGLAPYTLEADKFRTQHQNPVLTVDGGLTISGNNDRKVWETIFQTLEQRMQRGDFTVIDATHNSAKLMNAYSELAKKYRYQVYYYQLDTPLEECLLRNRQRDSYKFVPEEQIHRAHALIQEAPISNSYKRIHELREIENYFTLDAEQYQQVKIIGDVHGCYTVLSEALKEGIDPNTLYIFAGDYVDRGIEHYETLCFLEKLAEHKNVLFLEGNHEIHLYNWARGDEVKSRQFVEHTMPEIYRSICKTMPDYDENADYSSSKNLTSAQRKQINEFKKRMRMFCYRLRQCVKFTFNGQSYLVTHGGLTSVPKLLYVSAREMIKGVGNYQTQVATYYDQNYEKGLCQDLIQFHGHRHVEDGKYSYCLEDGVEFGRHLKIATIDRINGITIQQYKNNVFKEQVLMEKNKTEKLLFVTESDDVNELIAQTKFINTKAVEPNLLSISFNSKAFFKKFWSDLVVKARGLFVDAKTGKVKLRAYNKFFNYGEMPATRDDRLRENLAFPVVAFKKYNGFLGIMANVNGQAICASKTTTQGEFALMFQELWQQENEKVREQLMMLSQKYDCSFVFEVCHLNDRHIIDFDKPQLYLLDAIRNELTQNGENLDLDFSRQVLSEIDLQDASIIVLKEQVAVINDFDALKTFIKHQQRTEMGEGFVLQDKNAFLFKLKCDFYSDWKRRRGLVFSYVKHHQFNYSYCKNAEDVAFMKFVVEQLSYDEVASMHIIDLRNLYLEGK